MFTRRRSRGDRYRVFFATDVHGSERCFRKFLAAASVYEADALVLGGDIAGKGLVPLQAVNGELTAEIQGQRVTVPAGQEEWLREEVNRLGFYPVVMSTEDVDRISKAQGELSRLFSAEIVGQIQRWCDLAAERLKPHVRCIITPGNDDPVAIDSVLRDARRVECPERELCELGPVLMASLGDVTPTPWHTDREYSEDELAARIDGIFEQAPVGHATIMNFHCPPYGSGLDVCPELDGNLAPVIRGGHPSMVSVGSKAVRAAIMRYRPTVGLHGHIHESRGAQKLGRTICLNPGSDYTADILRGALVDLAPDGACDDFLLTAG